MVTVEMARLAAMCWVCMDKLSTQRSDTPPAFLRSACHLRAGMLNIDIHSPTNQNRKDKEDRLARCRAATAWEGVQHAFLAFPASPDKSTSDLPTRPTSPHHSHTSRVCPHSLSTGDNILLCLYTHHVLDCAQYLALACTTLYHNPSTQPGVFQYAPLAFRPPLLHAPHTNPCLFAKRHGFRCTVLFWPLLPFLFFCRLSFFYIWRDGSFL